MKHMRILLLGLVVAAFVGTMIAGCAKKPPAPQKPKAECQTNEDCGQGKVCKSGKCIKKVVKPKVECKTDDDCADPKICQNGKCVYECSIDDDCDEGYQCTNHKCVEAEVKCDLEPVYFEFDQYYLTTESQETLREMVKCLLKKKPSKIRVEGYCDERGTDAYNLALGDKRAKSIKKFMVELGIDPNIIETVSYGEEYASHCTNEDCWSKDRKGITKIEE